MWKKLYNESDESVKLIDTGLAMVAIAIIALVNHAIKWHKRGEELKAWALMELAKDEAKDKKEHHFVEMEMPDVVQL